MFKFRKNKMRKQPPDRFDVLTDLTWGCEVCKDTRPDSKISVFKTTTNTNGILVQRNVRHCNDREACVDGAFELANNWETNFGKDIDHVVER